MSGVAIEQVVLDEITHDGRKRIPALTGIRGVAAGWVVAYHFCAMAARLPALSGMLHIPIVDRGYLGVDLFFILSGFVLALNNQGKAQTSGFGPTQKFIIGRMFRIFPLHWCILLCYLLALPFMGRGWPSDDLNLEKNFILSVMLIQSWAHMPLVWNPPAWSLSDELLAYLTFPMLILAIVRVRHRWLALTLAWGAFAALGGLCASTKLVGLNHTQGLGMIRCLLEFPAGIVLCRIVQLKPLSQQAAAGAVAGGIALLALGLSNESLDVLALPAFSLLILSCASDGALPTAIFGNACAHFLGKISFSVYLVHALILEVGARIADVWAPGSVPARLSILALAVGAIFPMAYLTWRFVEVKGQALGRAFMSKGRLLTAARSPLTN